MEEIDEDIGDQNWIILFNCQKRRLL